MHSRELAMTLLLSLGGCAQSASVDTIRNDPAAHSRGAHTTGSDAPTLAKAPSTPTHADAVPAAPTAALRVETADAAGAETTVAPEEVEHCRARVCPRWKGAAAVNTAARVRTRKAP